ncbi:LCP family protein required for cell wall assembly [Kitasatospora sp. MAA4]|uniref:LCP family protein n=1 Tax=Kitasatospora sp. MAA4 TaxID=3035093 RepID=UPI002474E339|nr:LCP family protein [Kitasatospora sp. MAA4]MDH6136936.1 LCP family protein required for cell wall assembly [Kitasatospora sp. MAA4]
MTTDEQRTPVRRSRRRWPKIIALTLGGALVASCGAGYLYLRHLDHNIQHAPLSAGNPPPPPGPTDSAGHSAMNILIIGTDSRAGLGGAYGDIDNTGIGNNDVNILLHVSPDRDSAVALSLPRDTLVDLPQCTDPKTGEVYRARTHRPLNEALGRGGPSCVSDTVESITHLKVDHFALVNFQGVKDITDAVGGVEVNLCRPIVDRESHLNLPAGRNTLTGEQGLEFVRTRMAVQDGSSLGRFTMQRAFLAALLKKVTSAGTLLDPTTAFPVIEAATKSITVDDGLAGTTKLVELGTQLKDVKPADVAFVQPLMRYTPDDPNPELRAKAAFVQPQADRLFGLILADQPLTGGSPGQGASPSASATSAVVQAADISPSPSPSASPSGTSSPGVSVHTGDEGGCVQGWTGSLDQ